ncbi:hypothetical protein HYFRA_00012815 [Hymenoscyphus fraxineus]|uniref:Major facilitator superfamily (MFS) profile domain-containing protein n=1 Tax=Hymenoscyphus fraxineus TaxID=746836 RepID=A0A9N9L4R0_9HELO|nr:hypothetical protein HYFRA_00012815 [Hymenoscyphus fraxineus]
MSLSPSQKTLNTSKSSSEKKATPSVEIVVESSVPANDIDPEDEVTGVRLYLIHTIICLCTFLVGLNFLLIKTKDFNLLATAIPRITTQFHSLDDVGWYGAAFSIALCSCQPLAGKIYILFPKKLAYILFVSIFEIGNLVCATAPTSAALIAGRVVSGIGASGVFAGGFAILTTIVPLHKRPIYMGTISSTFALASIVGPVISGSLTEHVSWRWCFYINPPCGAFAVALLSFLFRVKTVSTERAPLIEKLKGLDGVGFVLFSGSTTMLLLALQLGGGSYPWNSSTIVGLFVGFPITLAVFCWWQLRLQDTAMIPPRIFKSNRNPSLLFVSSILMSGPFEVIVFWLPIWFQAILEISPEQSGIRFLPTVIADALTRIIGSGINLFILLGFALVSLGPGLITTIHPGISNGHLIGYQILGGIGYSLCSSLNHIGMQASLPQELIPLGATILLFGVSMSGAVFLAIGQAVFESRLTGNLGRVVPETVVEKVLSTGATGLKSVVDAENLPVVLQAYSESITQVFYIAAAAPVIGFMVLLGARWTRLKKKDAKEETEKHSDDAVASV